MWTDTHAPASFNDMLFTQAARRTVQQLKDFLLRGLARRLPTHTFGGAVPLPVVVALVGGSGTGKTTLVRHIHELLIRHRAATAKPVELVFLNPIVDNADQAGPAKTRTARIRRGFNDSLQIRGGGPRALCHIVYVMEDVDTLLRAEWAAFASSLVRNRQRRNCGPLLITATTPLTERFRALFKPNTTCLQVTMPTISEALAVALLRRLPNNEARRSTASLLAPGGTTTDHASGDLRQLILRAQFEHCGRGGAGVAAWGRASRAFGHRLSAAVLLAAASTDGDRRAAAEQLAQARILDVTLAAANVGSADYRSDLALLASDQALPPEWLAAISDVEGRLRGGAQVGRMFKSQWFQLVRREPRRPIRRPLLRVGADLLQRRLRRCTVAEHATAWGHATFTTAGLGGMFRPMLELARGPGAVMSMAAREGAQPDMDSWLQRYRRRRGMPPPPAADFPRPQKRARRR